MNGLQLTDFNSILDVVNRVRSRRELVAITEHIDNEFLNKRLEVSDKEWPLFNEMVKQKIEKLDLLKSKSSLPGDI